MTDEEATRAILGQLEVKGFRARLSALEAATEMLRMMRHIKRFAVGALMAAAFLGFIAFLVFVPYGVEAILVSLIAPVVYLIGMFFVD